MLNSSQVNQNLSFGVPMSFRRVGRLMAMGILTLVCLSCGEVYRPVVIPLSTTPPTPAGFHTVFSISANVPTYPGSAMQIDVAGDSIAAETPTSDKNKPNLGDNPTHAAILPNNSRVFVASPGSVLPGGVDVVSSFIPAPQSTTAIGFGAVTTISLPAGSQPVFVNTTQSNVVYVANYNSNSVSAISTSTNSVTNTATVGVHPVALAETPNGLKIYSANQGDNSVSSLNTSDLSANAVTGFTGTTPVWAVARGDSQKVYVLTQGDGQLVTIDTATDSVMSSLPVGAGANFIFFDSHLNRLYVTNPITDTVYVFSDTGGANDTPVQLAAISFALGSAPCASGPAGCSPASVTALPDGSRFYVASYQTAASCPDAFVGLSSPCVIPGLAVFDAKSLALKTTMTLLTDPPFAANLSAGQYQYAVPPVAACVPANLYSPSSTRFRVFTAASADSSRVFVSMCDAGAVAVINTTNSNANNPGGGTPPDTLITDLPAPFSTGAIQPNGVPPNQNPIFLLTGQ
jgi:YVTN family beta-propeller protein